MIIGVIHKHRKQSDYFEGRLFWHVVWFASLISKSEFLDVWAVDRSSSSLGGDCWLLLAWLWIIYVLLSGLNKKLFLSLIWVLVFEPGFEEMMLEILFLHFFTDKLLHLTWLCLSRSLEARLRLIYRRLIFELISLWINYSIELFRILYLNIYRVQMNYSYDSIVCLH